jgi:hypothetical protein
MKIEGRAVDTEPVGDVLNRDGGKTLFEREPDEGLRQFLLGIEAALGEFGQSRHGGSGRAPRLECEQ